MTASASGTEKSTGSECSPRYSPSTSIGIGCVVRKRQDRQVVQGGDAAPLRRRPADQQSPQVVAGGQRAHVPQRECVEAGLKGCLGRGFERPVTEVRPGRGVRDDRHEQLLYRIETGRLQRQRRMPPVCPEELPEPGSHEQGGRRLRPVKATALDLADDLGVEPEARAEGEPPIEARLL